MATYIRACDENRLYEFKVLARTTYNAGIVAAQGFNGKIVPFKQMYRFADDKPAQSPIQVAQGLIAWAERANADYARSKKE